MNINRLIEKKTIDFKLDTAIEKYKKVCSENESSLIHFVNDVQNELNTEYENAVASVNLANKRSILNVFDMASIIGIKSLLSGYIVENRFEEFKNEFERVNKQNFNLNDTDFLFEAYSLMVTNTNTAYKELRKQARKLIEEAINSNVKEI